MEKLLRELFPITYTPGRLVSTAENTFKKNHSMNNTRRLALLSKANNFVVKLTASRYTDDGKAVYTLLYQVDTMIYGLASINTDDWRSFLGEFKAAKYVLRTHSKDENVKKANFANATSSILQTLEKYIKYLQIQSAELE